MELGPHLVLSLAHVCHFLVLRKASQGCCVALYLGRPVSLESREPWASQKMLPWGTFKEIPTPAVSSALPLENVDFPIPLAELRHVTIPHHLCPTRGWGAGYHNTALSWEGE